jgi:starch phosphorylase
MKASLNGALQLTTSDGWVDEVEIDPIGWRLPANRSAEQLYDLLEHEIAPIFYNRTSGIPTAWVKKMRANQRLINHKFTTSRMLEDYYSKLYAPAAQAGRKDLKTVAEA